MKNAIRVNILKNISTQLIRHYNAGWYLVITHNTMDMFMSHYHNIGQNINLMVVHKSLQYVSK